MLYQICVQLSFNFSIKILKLVITVNNLIMVHGTFPLAKFTFLVIKQIASPIHKGIVTGAKKNNIIRNYLCLPLAKWYNKCDIRIRYRHQNWRKIEKKTMTDDKNAIDTGASILSEVIVGITIFIIFFFEYNSYSAEDLNLEIVCREEKNSIIERLTRLEETVRRQSIELDNLAQILAQLRGRISTFNSK